MYKTVYIFNSGKLKRKDNTIVLISKDDCKKSIPVNMVSDIHIFGEIITNKRFLEFLTKNRICLHFYNRNGWYVGSYYPRFYLNSGYITLRQVEFYLDQTRRLFLAKMFVEGGVKNILKNLGYYYRLTGNDEIKESIEDIEDDLFRLNSSSDIFSVMSVEGKVRKRYYEVFNVIVKQDGFGIDKRGSRPPTNPINALISFGNSLIYTTILSEIFRTYLDPRIGYLHYTNNRSFSLNLDIAEVFKPVIVDRIIFQMINKKEISLDDFHKVGDGVFLNEEGMKKFVQKFEEKMRSVVKYKKLGKVSYRKLIRLECYKLYKHFIGEEEYKPFVMEW